MTGEPVGITRRGVLAGASAGAGALLGAHATTTTAVARNPQSSIGRWATDSVGLPVYQFTADLPVTATTPQGARYPLEPDPYAMIGNDRLTLFTYASGLFLAMSGDRGWVRLNNPAGDKEANGASITVTRGAVRSEHKLLGKGGICTSGRKSTREFGCGTARYRMNPEPQLTVERVLSVAPSTANDRGQAATVISVRITNDGQSTVDVDYVETVLSDPRLKLNHRPDSPPPVRFINTAALLPGGMGVICNAVATSEDPVVLTPREAPNRYNLFPPSMVLLAPARGEVPVHFAQSAIDGGGVELTATASVRLAPRESKQILLVVALKSAEDALETLTALADNLKPSNTGDYFRQDWAHALTMFEQVPDRQLRSELAWDGHALLAMATWSAYHGHTFIPQGMTYDYHMDLTAAPRDHLQHSLAASYFAPHLAKSTILYTLCKMTYQGEIKYTDFGNGETSNSAWNTSDQQIFLFWSIGEYLRITRDWSILQDKTAYLPKEANFSGSTLEKLEHAFIYLRDEVSVGEHGLIRLMNSDWSDMVYGDIPMHRYFQGAESHLNTAMAMAVMPNLIAQLAAYGRAKGGATAAQVTRLVTGMQLYVDRVSAAMMRDMEGRTFTRRVYLDAETAMGDDNMHLEPQSFLLQAPGFPVERKRALYKEMQHRVIDGEALGPRQREKPVVGGGMAPGTSENGGYWYALAGQAITGVATFDRQAALTLLDRMTFRNFSKHYPDYWVGQWTAPDVINATYCGDLAGLPRPVTENNGMWANFASYCAHAHAWPVYCYHRIRDAT